MADKKITALTAMTQDGKNEAADLLHIIDHSASPVNKKITLAHFFDKINTPITSYGAHNHKIGPAAAIPAISTTIPLVAPAAGNETEVVINESKNAFVDFRVETGLSISAFQVDSSLDTDNGSCNTVTINGDFAKVDFRVNSDESTATTPLLHCDATDHSIGIGKEDPDTAYLLDIAAVSGKSIKCAGSIDITGSIDTTGITTTSTVAHTAAGALPLTARTILLTVDGTTAYTLPNGTDGQELTIVCVAVANTPDGTVSPVSANFTAFATLDIDAVGEIFHLIFVNSKWQLISYRTGGIT